MKPLVSTVKDYVELVSDIFELSSIQLFLTKIGLLVLAFLAPIQNIIFGVLFLIVCDLVTGVTAAVKKKEKITSSKLSRTISKVLVYFITIVVCHVINQHLLFGPDVVPLENLVTSFIALTELKSILENLDKMSKGKHTAIASIILALSNERFRQQTPKKINDKKKK